jgi:sugar lactone lactonase YvrE
MAEMKKPLSEILRVKYSPIMLFVVFSLLSTAASRAQNLLNLPESVVYDSPNYRYLVSNWGNGDVVQIDSTGTHSIFIDNEHCYAGLQILDDVLYVACREYGVKGFDLATGENVLEVSIPGIDNINDITADTSGNLYVSSPPGNAIFKVNIASQTYSTFVESGLYTPNGIYFDEPNNRLLVVSYRNYSPIQAVDLEDSTLSTVYSTNLHNLDGLTQDSDGYYYVSSWFSNACFRIDSTFSSPPELFSSHADDPADIYFNKVDNVLAVPLFFTHGLELVAGQTIVEGEGHPLVPTAFTLFPNFPNPFNPRTTIQYYLPKETKVTLKIYNTRGQEVRELVDEYQSAGLKSVVWDGRNNSGMTANSGVYIQRIRTTDHEIPVQSRKMVLSK